jgi:choline dehydrogenase-like flavoprotein
MIDARTDAIGETLVARVAIIGAGAAGLSLARRLAAKMDGVLLVEAGNRALDGATQGLAAGRSIGIPYYDLLATRLRFYGGTTNHWAGYCRSQSPLDWEARPDLGILPWPVDGAVMQPYLSEAARIVGIRDTFFDQPGLIAGKGRPADQIIENRPGFSGTVETRTFQLAPKLRLGKDLWPELEKLAGLKQVLNLNAVEIIPGPGRDIAGIRARTTTGKEVMIKADAYVIACHGIENARLLLNSTARDPSGVGNRTGKVGLHFSEHPALVFGAIVPGPGFASVYDEEENKAVNLDVHLSLSERTMRERGVLNYYCRLLPRYSGDDVRTAMGQLAASFFQPFDPAILSDIRIALSDPGGAANELVRRVAPSMVRPRVYYLRHRFEQAPNVRSRVVLSDRKNAIGQRQADLDWQFSDLDIKTMQVGTESVIREMSALGFGRVSMEPVTRAVIERNARGTHHQMSTTRMAERPEDGVVDFNARVHEHDNLYVAGSSVFPHPGDAAPTITLMAMAMRLGDHLLDRFA